MLADVGSGSTSNHGLGGDEHAHVLTNYAGAILLNHATFNLKS